MSKPWGGAGAWAAEAERAEAEEKERAAAVAPAASFPSLKESVKQQQKKKKMTLSEFYAAGGGKEPGGARGLTPDEVMRLPTGPKERSAEEMQYGRLGGGFTSYGGGGRRDADREGSWGGSRRSYGGGYDEDRRGSGGGGGGSMQPRVSEFEPSRADGADDWGAGKKAFVSNDAGARPSRGGFGGGGGGGDEFIGAASRADGVGNWAAGKRAPAPAAPVRSSTFGAGGSSFRDAGPDSDKWSRGGSSFRQNNGQERARLVLEPRSEGNVSNAAAKVNKPSPFGAARPREEVLAEKGWDWKKLDSDLEARGLSRPTSSQSSRPNSAQSSKSENVGLQGGARPKVNPFGDAKPREVLLEAKGKDWRKIDMELERRVDRPETEEEKILKDEINQLKELEKDPNPQETRPDAPNIKDTVNQKEKELDQLARELDDKIRFGQKGVDRPGSGAARAPGFYDRPPSRTGSVDEPRGTEFVERPRSRGTADVWSRSGDDRRSFYGGRERGFLGHRDMDRTRARDRW